MVTRKIFPVIFLLIVALRIEAKKKNNGWESLSLLSSLKIK